MNCPNGHCVFKKMNTYREQGQFTDVTFIIDGARLKAHKNVLSCRSDVFEVMFTSPMTEAAIGEVVITDASKEVFELFLSYLYLKTLEFSKFKVHYVVELLYLAEKYLIESLRNRCVIEIEKSVASGNLVYMLEVANSFNVKTITKKAVDVILTRNDEVVENGMLDMLSKDFGLSSMVLSETPPATVTLQWSGNLAHYCMNQYSLRQNFLIRNNGNFICGEVQLWYADSALHIYIKPNARLSARGDAVWDRPLEMSYWVKVLGSEAAPSIIHSSSGNLWWHQFGSEICYSSFDDLSCLGELRRPLCKFNYNPHRSVVDETLFFTVKLTQWDRSSRVYKKPIEPTPSDSICSSISLHAVDVNKFYSRRTKLRSKWIPKSTYKKLKQYKSTKVLPKDEDVDVSLIYAAKEYSCIDLQRHCETVFLSKLTVDNAVDILIRAKDMCLTLLCSKTTDFINMHHLGVMATSSWNLLENRPDLIASILKAVLVKPPEFEPFSKEPYPVFTLPHENSEEEASDEEDGSSYNGGFLSEFDEDYY